MKRVKKTALSLCRLAPAKGIIGAGGDTSTGSLPRLVSSPTAKKETLVSEVSLEKDSSAKAESSFNVEASPRDSAGTEGFAVCWCELAAIITTLSEKKLTAPYSIGEISLTAFRAIV